MKPMLDVVGLCKSFPVRNVFGRLAGEVKAVDHVSFSIERGEVYGLAGESGSGKSTIARMIMGLTRPDSGDIFLDGENITGTGGTREHGIGLEAVSPDGKQVVTRFDVNEATVINTMTGRYSRPFRPPPKHPRRSPPRLWTRTRCGN